MSVPFLILAALTLVSACAAMLLRGLVHCALALAVAFAGLGALYLALGAQFLGLAQLLVYVGAIAVLIVFVILLTRGGEAASTLLSPAPPWMLGILVSGAIFAILAWAIFHSSVIHSAGPPAPPPSIRQLGDVLMQGYVLPLEVIGLMLTAALIGAVIVAMKEKQGTE
ncbi:MAG TPA: NADH-quinone oxidoreductase subunit J [Acidobacteriaceae bacterium]